MKELVERSDSSWMAQALRNREMEQSIEWLDEVISQEWLDGLNQDKSKEHTKRPELRNGKGPMEKTEERKSDIVIAFESMHKDNKDKASKSPNQN